MPRPIVLVAWEPATPEEALAVQERLSPLAEVRWAHELSRPLRADLLSRIEVLLVAEWREWITRALPRMRSLRFVQAVGRSEDFPVAALASLPTGPLVARGFLVDQPDAHLERVKRAARNVREVLQGRVPEGVVQSGPTRAPW